MCLTYKGHNEKNYIIISIDTKHDLNKIKYLFVKKQNQKSVDIHLASILVPN